MADTKTILLVEDDPVTREGLGLVLRRAGYETILAANGQEALACLGAGPRPDLVVLDMLLPILDGWQFLATLRDLPLPRVPILVMSSTCLSQEWAEDHDCRGFIKKPIDPDELTEEVNRCLERHK